MYSCTLGKVLNLVICLRYMYFFLKKYLKLLRLYFRYRYVSLPDCLATMSARGSGRTWWPSNQAASQQQDSAPSHTRGTAYSRIAKFFAK